MDCCHRLVDQQVVEEGVLQIDWVEALRIGWQQEALVAFPANWLTGWDQILHIHLLPSENHQETAETPFPLLGEDHPFHSCSCCPWTAFAVVAAAGAAFRTEEPVAVVHTHRVEGHRSLLDRNS